MKIDQALSLSLIFAIAGSLAVSAQAESNWDKSHPRRAEVNQRLAKQNARIDRKVSEGEMSPGRAAKLHREDRQIRQEEHDMASQDHGHITRQEQRTLNRQEDQVSRQIAR